MRVVSSDSRIQELDCPRRESIMGSWYTYVIFFLYLSSSVASTNDEQLGQVKPFSRE